METLEDTSVGSKKAIWHIFWSLNLKEFVNPYQSLISLTLTLPVQTRSHPRYIKCNRFQISNRLESLPVHKIVNFLAVQLDIPDSFLLPEFLFRKLISFHLTKNLKPLIQILFFLYFTINLQLLIIIRMNETIQLKSNLNLISLSIRTKDSKDSDPVCFATNQRMQQ